MKNSSKNMATAVFGRKVAAALLVAGAYGTLATPVSAQQTTAPAAQQMAAAPESTATPPLNIYRSAPFARSAMPVSESEQPIAAAATSAAPSAPVKFERPAEKDLPFVLEPELRTWPLQYAEPGQLNTLYFTLPTDRESRVMLPGNASDAADHVRFTVSRYITDNIGAAAQARGRQLELFSTWLANHDKQKQALPKDPWAAYQFSQESYPVVRAFKEKVESQTAPSIARMVEDVSTSVAKIAPVMEAAGSYEVKLQWYNVLVQLKEGVGLYQARATEADRQILDAIAEFENANPPVPRPPGSPPRTVRGIVSTPSAQLTSAAPGLTVAPQREEAKPIPTQEAPSQVGGIVVLLGVAGVVFGLFLKLRRRVANKGSTKNTGAA